MSAPKSIRRKWAHEIQGVLLSAEVFVMKSTSGGRKPFEGVCPRAMLDEMQKFREGLKAAFGETE